MKLRNRFDKEAFAKAISESPLTRQQIADAAGIADVSDISRYIRGDTAPRMARLKRLVEVLGPSITGLAFVHNGHKKPVQFSKAEREIISRFEALPYSRQGPVLGYCQARYEFGNDADAEFAADLVDSMNDDRQPQEQSG